jgi:hypothetical protein
VTYPTLQQLASSARASHSRTGRRAFRPKVGMLILKQRLAEANRALRRAREQASYWRKRATDPTWRRKWSKPLVMRPAVPFLDCVVELP